MVERPLVSVIMPSYNMESNFLHEAVESVLHQTYTNFELIIVDDGSIPSVTSIISDIVDKRITVICNPGNKGLPYSLNHGLNEAKGKYIFRMDSDDKCLENRLERQVEYFEGHPEVDVVSTFAHSFGAVDIVYKSFTQDKQIKAELLWKNPIIHPTAGLRTETIEKYKIEYSSEEVSEDFEIWSRLAFTNHCVFAVISEELLMYRVHAGQVTAQKQDKLKKSEANILKRNLETMKIKLTQEEFENYFSLSKGSVNENFQMQSAFSAMKKILEKSQDQVSSVCLKRLYRKGILKYCLHRKCCRDIIYMFAI